MHFSVITPILPPLQKTVLLRAAWGALGCVPVASGYWSQLAVLNRVIEVLAMDRAIALFWCVLLANYVLCCSLKD